MAQLQYGVLDASFQAAGCEPGLRKLVDDFYDFMDAETISQKVRRMHPEDLEISREKLAVFLAGWLGGPKRYAEKWGPMRIPAAHAHLAIGYAERDAWMHCMRLAVARQPWADDFKEYFLTQIAVPAERVRNST